LFKLIEEFREIWSLHGSEMPPPVAGFLSRFEVNDRDSETLVIPHSEGESPFDIIGCYSAFILVDWLDAEVARACLPPELELDPPPDAPAGKHPVMYSFGRHSGVRPRFFHLWDYNYEEALVGLPCVRFRDRGEPAAQPYYFMTAVRLDNLFADEIGVALGMPKEMADITQTATTYAIRKRPDNNLVMSGSFLADPGHFPPDLPNFRTIERLVLNQPVISQSPLGPFLLTPFHIDTQNAVMSAATATLTIADNGLPGLPAGDYRYPGIDVTPFGGCYHSVHHWTMSVPSPVLDS
jgi:hypothetical protein